jgi:transcriptional regulator with GAF, ATPase, and Fis domain
VSTEEIIGARRVAKTSDALDELWSTLTGEETTESALGRLADVVLRVITDADAVSVTIHPDDGPRTVAATHEWAITIDKNQYAVGDGPCLEAARIRETVLVSGSEAFAKWPEFAADSAAYGVHAYLSAPLVLSEELIGAMNVYGLEEKAFGRLDEALLRLTTTAAAAVISNARRYTRMRDVAGNLQAAMASRAEIEQAKGVLMAVHGIPADEAFQRLVARSQRTNTKLAAVASELLASVRTDHGA